MLDVPHSGFLMMDDAGSKQCLLIYTKVSLDEHYLELKRAGAPPSLLADVKAGAVIPIYDVQKTPVSRNHPALSNIELFYYPAKRISSATHTYFVSLTSDEYLHNLHDKLILPYRNFLETNNLGHHIVH
jgi:hypothetical protein